MSTVSLRVAHRVACTAAEGPHRRAAVWVQGCSLACPGCCNPELFATTGGEAIPVATLVAELAQWQMRYDVEGLSILGGEPLQQMTSVTALAAAAQALGLGVIVFTGYTLEALRQRRGFAALTAVVDTLVDGRYDARTPEPPDGRRFVGSQNQRLLHHTTRYANATLWQGPQTVELQLASDGTFHVHGTPSLARNLARSLQRPAPARA